MRWWIGFMCVLSCACHREAAVGQPLTHVLAPGEQAQVDLISSPDWGDVMINADARPALDALMLEFDDAPVERVVAQVTLIQRHAWLARPAPARHDAVASARVSTRFDTFMTHVARHSDAEECVRRAAQAVRLSQDMMWGQGVEGYVLYAEQALRALKVMSGCLDASARLPERALAAHMLRDLLRRAPSPARVMWSQWESSVGVSLNDDVAMRCAWDGGRDAKREERVRDDLGGWRREHADQVLAMTQLAHDDQLIFLEALVASDPVPCKPPDPLVWRLGQGLAAQRRMWDMVEGYVAGNVHARAELRDEVYNRHTRRIMERVMSIDTSAVDVGSFRGELLREMVDVAPAGHHVGVEPMPEFAALLRERFAHEHVQIHEVALSDTAGTATFSVVKANPGYSGLKSHGLAPEKITQVAVQVARLDDVLSEGVDVGFIKIDVEGAEYAVWGGAQRVVCERKPVVVFEFGLRAAQSFEVTTEMMWARVSEACGLQLHTLVAWLDDGPPLTREAFIEMVEQNVEFYFVASAPSRRGASD